MLSQRRKVGSVISHLDQAHHTLLGISSYDVSLEKQEVVVRGPAEYDYILEKIKKTGKEVTRSRSDYLVTNLIPHPMHPGPFWRNIGVIVALDYL